MLQHFLTVISRGGYENHISQEKCCISRFFLSALINGLHDQMEFLKGFGTLEYQVFRYGMNPYSVNGDVRNTIYL